MPTIPYDAPYDTSGVQPIDAMTPSWVNVTYDPGPHPKPATLPPPELIIDALGNRLERAELAEPTEPEDTGDEPVIRPANPT